MRISDWSSDVCSSDLVAACAHNFSSDTSPVRVIIVGPSSASLAAARPLSSRSTSIRRAIPRDVRCIALAKPMPDAAPVIRSEEHTSELQSLMRISYAVFCLKKKSKKHHAPTQTNYEQQHT